MTPEEIHTRIEQERDRVMLKIAGRADRPEQMWWLSFADDDGFRGACIVHADEFTEAVLEASLHQCNPHGEVQGMDIPPGNVIPDKWKYRILSRKDCAEFDKEMLASQPHE